MKYISEITAQISSSSSWCGTATIVTVPTSTQPANGVQHNFTQHQDGGGHVRVASVSNSPGPPAGQEGITIFPLGHL